MAAINLHYPKMKVFQLLSTQVAAGAKIYTYEAGTSTDKATYSDQGLTTANANPVICDSNGEANVWLLDDGLYKIVINDSDDVLVSSTDNIGTAAAASSTDGLANLVPNGSFETNTGDNGTPTGWTLNITTAATIQIDTTDSFHGDSSLEFVGGASGAGYAESGFFEVQTSKELGIRFSLKASAATVNQVVDIYWFQSDQTASDVTVNDTIYSVTTTAPTSWTEQVLTATAPSDGAFAKIRINGSSDAGTTRYDNVVVEGLGRAASQAEVDAGTVTTKFVTPETLAATDSFLPDAVSGYDRGEVINIKDDRAYTGFNISTNVTVSTYESIGPTGSGATNIWTVLDDIPLTATQVLVKAYVSATHNASAFKYIRVRARETGGAGGVLEEITEWYGDATSGNGITSVGIDYVPLDSANKFEVNWDYDSAWGTTTTVQIYVMGWVE